MNHHPFDSWLLSGETWTPAQNEALDAHLQACPACRRLQDGLRRAETALEKAPAIGPTPGFVDRWTARQSHDVAARRQTEAWGVLAGLTVAATLLASLISVYLFTTQTSLSVLAASLLEEIVRWTLVLRVVGGIGKAVALDLPAAALSVYALYFTWFVLATAFVAAAWSMSFRHLSQRGVQS